MSAVDLSQLGRGRGLRVLDSFGSGYEFRGHCFGAAIVLISIYLDSRKFETKHLTRTLKKAKEQVITVQKLQGKLAGLEGKCPKKVISQFNRYLLTQGEIGEKFQSEEVQMIYEQFKNFIRSQSEDSLREHLLSGLESRGSPLTKNLYALILEISGSYEKSIKPEAHRFHKLQKDILEEITRLYSLKTEEIASYYGDENQFVETVLNLPEGVYHISFSRHSFVYIKEDTSPGWLWDTIHRFRKVEKSAKQKKILAKSVRGWYTAKVNWIVFTRILKEGEDLW